MFKKNKKGKFKIRLTNHKKNEKKIYDGKKIKKEEEMEVELIM